MTLVQCIDLQLILLAIFVISLIVLMEQVAEYCYFEEDSMKIKIISVCFPKFFNGEKLPSFTDEVKYFIKYKKHWWQRYRYLNDRFTRPMKFDSFDAAKEFLKKKGIDYEGRTYHI